MRWLDKAINFYTEWNENDKRKSSRFDISNESDFLRDYTGIRSVSIGLNYKGTDPYDSLISLLKNAKDIESLSIVGMKLSWKQVCELPLKRLRKFKKLRNLKTLDMRYMNGDNAETLHWLGIENVIVSKRDVAIDDIKRKVEDLNRNAVSRLRSKERSLSNVELPRIQRTMLLREMQRPFERLIKNYIKANYEDKLERLQAGEYYMNSYLPKDEYIAIFKEKALQEYPFLAYEL